MTGIEVATVVASIISAFGNGMDVFRRITGRKRKKRGREATTSEEETWLRRSLETRPLDIRKTYDLNVAKLGRRFEIGDSLAHSSLAHTLLVLNAGLINLINHALSEETPTRSMSTRSLLSLSESAASDTLQALSQLSLRLSAPSQIPAKLSQQEKSTNLQPKSMSVAKSPAPRKKRPGPAPLLVRGGWVRPKSSSALSTSLPPSKTNKNATVKTSRNSSESSLAKSSKKPEIAPKSRSKSPQKAPITPLHSEKRDNSQVHTDNKEVLHEKLSLDCQRRIERQPSMLIVPSDFFNSLQQIRTEELPPPRPPKVPLETRPITTIRPRPPSTSTFMTVSTKIGEIPEPKDSERMPSLAELRHKHGPVLQKTMSDVLAHEEPRRRARGLGFKFWKRDGVVEDRMRSAMAY